MSTTNREGHQASGYDRPAHHSRLRLLVMAVAGIGAAVAVGLLKSWSYAPAMGWAAACATYLVWVWSIIGSLHAGATAAHAAAQPIAGAYDHDFRSPTATAAPMPATAITRSRRRE